MARTRNAGKRAAEQQFPFRVDIPVPPVTGLGGRLNAMHDWCRANITAGEWDKHGHSEKQPGQVAVDFARFYFMRDADAALFRCRWMERRQPSILLSRFRIRLRCRIASIWLPACHCRRGLFQMSCYRTFGK